MTRHAAHRSLSFFGALLLAACGAEGTAPSTVATPTFGPAAGTYTSAQSVAISSSTPGATIRYTTDGSTPSETLGTVYAGPVAVSSSTTLRAVAYQADWITSGVASAAFTILEGTVKWSVDVGSPIPGSPAISASGTIYAVTSNGRLHALDAEGAHSVLASYNQSTSGSPSIGADGTIFIGTLENNILGYWPDGTLRGGDNCYGAIAGFPAIGPDGRIYYGGGNWGVFRSDPGFTIRYSSTLLYYSNGPFRSSPAVGADGTLYLGGWVGFGGGDGQLHALDTTRYNTQKWFYPLGAATYGSPAIGADGAIYIGTENGMLHAVNPAGTQRWSFSTGAAVKSSPALGPDGTVYVGCDDGRLYAIASDGSLDWAVPTGGSITSSPALGADGTVYVGSQDGRLYAINPDGNVRWSVLTGGPVNSSPTLGPDGIVYVGSNDGRLYAIHGSGAGLAESPWPMLGRNPRHTARAGTP